MLLWLAREHPGTPGAIRNDRYEQRTALRATAKRLYKNSPPHAHAPLPLAQLLANLLIQWGEPKLGTKYAPSRLSVTGSRRIRS
jgi:hypothetical protein